MKIEDLSRRPSDIAKTVQLDAKREVEQKPREFQRQLSKISDQQYHTKIETLIEKISEQGTLVANRADIKEFAKYRELITELINETVSNSFAFSKSEKFDARGRHKVYAIVRQVDEKLNDMTQQILDEQADSIALLKMADEIRGMLVDLYL